MLNSLRAEFAAGLPSLAGTRITAEIPISQAVLDELIRDHVGGAVVVLEDSDVIVGRIFGVGLKATIAGVQAPMKLVLRLPFVARMAIWTIRKRLPFVSLTGDHAIIDIAQLPQLAPHAALLRHSRLHYVRTTRGRLLVGVEFRL